MKRRWATLSFVSLALWLSACLQDVTVGFDTQPLQGDNPSSDAGAVRDAAQSSDAGLLPETDADIVELSDAGSEPAPEGGAPDAGPCAPSDCTVAAPPVGIQTEDACPNDEPRVCERDTTGLCTSRCPEPPPDLSCGGLHIVAKPNLMCGPDTFCRLELGSCDEGLMGMCTERPNVCVKESNPVCGCDGVTYENTCEAYRLAKSLRSLGACP